MGPEASHGKRNISRETARAMSAKDVAAAEASVSLWNQGDRAGFLAAGLERPFGWILRVEDGLIRDARTYLSREEALEAAGLSE